MRFFIFLTLLLSGFAAKAQSISEINQKIDQFLTDHVEDGLVDYNEIAQSDTLLDGIVFAISKVELNSESSESEKAFLINAYNVLAIKQVINKFPIDSPQDDPTFFTENIFKIGNSTLSLNKLEKKVIFKKYPDPRLHFALICAAKGCPKLASSAYTHQNLDEQLDSQTRKSLNNSHILRYDQSSESLILSKIFEWYREDFGKNKSDIINFLNQYYSSSISMQSSIEFSAYDWSLNQQDTEKVNREELSNLELYTPSALFRSGEFELNVFNSIYSQQDIRNENGELIPLGQTQNFFTSMIMFTTGVSKKTRFNVGLDLFISKARYTTGDQSAFDVFNTSDEAIFNRSLVSYIAPRIKFVPIKRIPRLSVQSALWIPISDELETNGFVAHQRYTWFTQIFYDQNIWTDFQIFLEADLLYRFATVESQRYDFFRTPVSAFFSWFPTSKSTIFTFGQYSPRFETYQEEIADDQGMNTEQFGLTQWFVQLGIGGKYQISNSLGIEISYSDFSFSQSEGAGYTVNFGLRYIYR